MHTGAVLVLVGLILVAIDLLGVATRLRPAGGGASYDCGLTKVGVILMGVGVLVGQTVIH